MGAEYRGSRGTYRITKHVATSGMGHVYEARDGGGRDVIMKFAVTSSNGKPIPPALYDEYVKRLRTEAEILRNFAPSKSPFIVGYLDESRKPDDFFLVMEKIRGKPLSKIIPPLGLPEDQIVDMSLDVLGGLEFVHTHNTVYRDVKPDNIMVTDSHRCVMIDFGAAKQGMTQAVSGGREAGTQIHTPGWSCPHQAEMKTSAECDLYAFGRVMFYMGTRQRSERFQDPLGRMKKKMRDIRPAISAGLSDLVDRTLDPEHGTVHTAGGMMAELRGLRQPAGARSAPDRVPRVAVPRVAAQPAAPGHAWGARQEPRIVLQGIEYRISTRAGGSLIGGHHDLIPCLRSGGGCNEFAHGRNIFVGWRCPEGCNCGYNPAHAIGRHQMRIWRDNGGRMCVVNNDPYRVSAIGRGGVWIPMARHKKEVLQDRDQVALLYSKKEGPYMEFTFYGG